MAKRAFFVLIAAVAFIAGSALPARAQMGAFEGEVKDAEGKPLVGAWVLIERTDVRGNYKVKTDKRGRYFHAGIPLGIFNLTLARDDKGQQKLDQVNNVRMRLGEPVAINFDLKEVRDRQLAAQAGIQLEQQPQGGGGGGGGGLSKEQRAKIEEQLKQREESRKKAEQLNSSFGAGMEALKLKNYEEAIPQFEAAAAADATQHVVFAQLAEACVGLARQKRGEEANGLYQKGLANYQKAIDLKPDDASYRNNYALALVSAGDIPKAEQELAKAAEMDPMNAGRYYFNLGAVLTNAGRGKEAGMAFRKATEVSPEYAPAWYQLGISLLSEAKLDEKTGQSTPVPGTIEALQKYLELDPNGAHSAEAKGMIEMLGAKVEMEIRQGRKARR